ncbi:MAG TPA: hypothetical protein VFH63_03915 [candidate division Zixibacteria bacterium]|nr:hypothetical protein [candidate division Zixibacteria bacterium]
MKVTLARSGITASWPRLYLGAIPGDMVRLDVAAADIRGISAPLGVDGGAAALGFGASFLGALGWFPAASPLTAAVLIIVGVALMASSARQLLRISCEDTVIDLPVSILERPRVLDFLRSAPSVACG